MNIKQKAFSGVKWTTTSTVVLALTAMLKVSVLARLLDKTEFGLMALVVFVLSIMDLFMDMGLTSAILHKQKISEKEYSSLYWVNFVFSLFLYIIMFTGAPLLSEFYSEPKLLELFRIMGLSLIISALGRQFKTIEQKMLNFKLIAQVEISSSILSLIAAIILAYYDFGVYALVYSALLKYVITNTFFLISGSIKYGLFFHFKFHETKPFLKIGLYQVGGQIINHFNRDLDVLIIGKFYGADTLGGYSLAKQLVFRPAMVINPVLTRVAAPVLAKFQTDITALKKKYLLLINLISSINVPIYLTIILFAPLIVKILYGSEFIDIVTLVRLLSCYMIFRAIGNPIGALVIATGKTNLEFYWGLFTLTVMPIAVIIGSQFSIEWVAFSITVTMILLLVPNWWFLARKMLNVSLITYLFWLIPGVFLIKGDAIKNWGFKLR